MWKRFVKYLVCPQCGNEQLRIVSFEETEAFLSEKQASMLQNYGATTEEYAKQIVNGLLLCSSCKTRYPVYERVPVMFPYATEPDQELQKQFPNEMKKYDNEYSPPKGKPVRGEELVLKSFSAEWRDYSYDNVLWTWSYDQREKIFLAETGIKKHSSESRNFLEIGCGLGVVTSFAHKHLRGDAVGVDLSGAVWKAAEHFQDNPFLHFVQASLWKLPFRESSFDMVYSHGVLHHTFSTEQAFRAISRFCADGGTLYIWKYGMGSIKDDIFRRGAWLLEKLIRPVLSRIPSGIANIILAPLAATYIVMNRIQRVRGLSRQPYNFSRALHAVRDRFTPLYAHRTTGEKAASWFREQNFDDIEFLKPESIPEGIQDTFRRNVGIRGRKKKNP